MVYSVKGKKLHAHTCKKYPRTCPSTMTKSVEFLLFTVVFLHPFALSLSLSLLFLIFFLSSSPLNLFSYYILWFLHQFLHPHVGQRWESFFSVLPCLFLNLSLLAVRLLVHYSGITSTLIRPES